MKLKNVSRMEVSEMGNNKKKYTLGRFIFDFIMGLLTAGIWWIYVLIKAIRES